MHHLTMSSRCGLIYGAFRRLQGRFRSVGSLACLPRPLCAMPALPTSNICNLTTTVQGFDDIQPLTVDDYHVLVEAGRLLNRRVELLRGQLVLMAPQTTAHSYTVSLVNDIFSGKLRKRAVVRPSMPMTLQKADSEPEPDLVIASGDLTSYMYRHPAADDIFLLVEVSNSTLQKDSIRKLDLYASENIPEYWIVDVKGRSVRVLRNPEGKCYLHDETFCAGDIAPAAFPDVLLRVENLFPF